MSKENVQKFYETTKEDKEINKELSEAMAADNIVGYAKDKGFEFTKAEHDEFIAEIAANVSELPDDQLAEVAGGFKIPGLPQIKVICKTCGWSSGWKNINGYYSYTTLTGLHYATTKHTNFAADYRK